MTVATVDTEYRGLRTESTAANELTVLIYGPIDTGDAGTVDSAQVVQALQDFKGQTIRIYINSPGGVVYGGLAIYNALRRHAARKEVQIDGICASAATIIAMAGDRITAAASATLMVHAVWNTTTGTADDMRQSARRLESLTETLVQLYVARTGKPRDIVAGWVRDQTWFTAAEALAVGLIDAIGDASRAVAQWDCALFGISAPPSAPDAMDPLLAEARRRIAPRPATTDRATVEALAAVNKLIEGFIEGLDRRVTDLIESKLETLADAYGLDLCAADCGGSELSEPADGGELGDSAGSADGGEPADGAASDDGAESAAGEPMTLQGAYRHDFCPDHCGRAGTDAGQECSADALRQASQKLRETLRRLSG